MLKMGYWYTKRQFGRVPGPLSVFCARMPAAFTSFYGKVGKLDRKLSLPDELASLVRQQVARINSCAFCVDANRWAALNKAGVSAEKLDGLDDYRDSPHFHVAERAALDYVTEVTHYRHCAEETVAELKQHFTERQICELVWLVASEHLYNINNIALGIGSAGMCELTPSTTAASIAA
jgi:AhpD family alkylhydroperoxidase